MPTAILKLAGLAYGAVACVFALGYVLARPCETVLAQEVAVATTYVALPAATTWLAFSWWTAVRKADSDTPSLRTPAAAGLLPFVAGLLMAWKNVDAACNGKLHDVAILFAFEALGLILAITIAFVIVGAIAAAKREKD